MPIRMSRRAARRRRAVPAVVIAASVVLTSAAVTVPVLAQGDAPDGYPKQPIKLVIGFAPGGGNDIMGRVVGQKLSERVGQPVVIENKPGAGGAIAAEQVARAAPDGYTFLIAPIGTMVFNPALFSKLPYDPIKSFTAISLIADFPLYLTVNATSSVKSVAELVVFAKANPEKANYASTSGVFQLITEMFKLKTGAPIEHIPFKSSGEMLTAIMTDQVTMAFVDPPPLMGHLKAGKVRILATTSAKRSADLPDVPTLAEAGVEGASVDAFTGLVGPANLPPAIVKKMYAEIAAVVASPEVVERFKQLAVNAVSMSPDAFSAMIARDIPRWKDVAKAANIKLD